MCIIVMILGMLWRYARASMSVAGIFPPMVDNRDGHLLLDGCYTNNVPGNLNLMFTLLLFFYFYNLNLVILAAIMK
uniref:Putative patatin-like phospholipase domain protein n=1 Tax=Anopheles darlingi TaxID=43151 RepID=A0A2M4DIT3_ANODA